MHYVTIGWRWLETTLNNIIREVNIQKPLQSASIAIEESPNGTLFKVVNVAEKTDQPLSSAGGGQTWPAGVGWKQMAVIDNSSGSCVTNYIWYWGMSPTGVQTPPPPNPQ